ncbi:hypothetical protein [Pseudomonas sp. EA_35y_Pfl2_R111]
MSSYWPSDSSPQEDQRAGLVLGYAEGHEAQIAEALQLLRKAWHL